MKRQEQDKLWKTGRKKKITKFSDKEIERKLVCLFAVLIASVSTRNWLALFALLFKHTSEKPVWRKETGEDEETHGGSGGLICRLLLPCYCGQDSGAIFRKSMKINVLLPQNGLVFSFFFPVNFVNLNHNC